jgi:H+/gluconate symporter-like permease
MYLGIIIAIALFIYLAMRGTSIFLVSLICTLIVILSNGMALDKALLEYFPFGKLGAFTFAGKFFLLFVAGAMFGRVTGDSGNASSIALALVDKLGAHRALLITVLTTALLTYGGVVVFVVIFAMYPLGLRLLKEANIPKRLFVGALVLGAGTFTLSAMPGTPSIQNVIAAAALGTDLFAGALYGIFASAIMFGLGMVYLESQRKKALAGGEGFEPSSSDIATMESVSDEGLPSWHTAILPLAVVLLTILIPRLLTLAHWQPTTGPAAELVNFATAQPLLWPCIALCLGMALTLALSPSVRARALESLGKGAEEAILPLMATAVVIGFGGVVSHTEGFAQFTTWVTQLDLPPIISLFVAVSLASAVVGSSTGGLQIFLSSMAPAYLAQGIEPEALHRIAAIVSGGFDSLPHCGAVVAILTITGLNHKQAYKDIGMVTVVFPTIAALATIGLYSLIG